MPVTERLQYDRVAIAAGQWWRLVTALFVQNDLWWQIVIVFALVAGFLIGRPYPLFNKLFHWAVDSGNPLYGAGAFILQSLGNDFGGRDPWIDFSQYPQNWPELSARKHAEFGFPFPMLPMPTFLPRVSRTATP